MTQSDQRAVDNYLTTGQWVAPTSAGAPTAATAAPQENQAQQLIRAYAAVQAEALASQDLDALLNASQQLHGAPGGDPLAHWSNVLIPFVPDPDQGADGQPGYGDLTIIRRGNQRLAFREPAAVVQNVSAQLAKVIQFRGAGTWGFQHSQARYAAWQSLMKATTGLSAS